MEFTHTSWDSIKELGKAYPQHHTALRKDIDITSYYELDDEVDIIEYNMPMNPEVAIPLNRPHYVITKIKLNVEAEKLLKRAMLECNGCIFDNVYKHAMKSLKHIYGVTEEGVLPFYLTTKSVFPCITHTPFTLRLLFNDESSALDLLNVMVSVTYKLTHRDEIAPFVPTMECKRLRSAHADGHVVFTRSAISSFCHDLKINLPVAYIIIKYVNVEFLNPHIMLQIDAVNTLHFDLNKLDKPTEDSFIIPLTPSIADRFDYTINMSKVSKCTLVFESAKEQDFTKSSYIYVYSVNTQVLLHADGTCIVRYSN